jgi:hypothetical protein
MKAVPGRVVCPRCGENNFDTQANCWKCGSSLAGTAPPPAAPSRRAAPAGTYPAPPVSVAPAVAGRSIDPAVAFWSAVALAFFFPAVAVPVGIVFLMLDDRRKAEIGRVTLVWGIIFSLLHLLLTAWLLRGMYEYVRPFVPGASAPSTPKPNDTVEPLHIPGEQSDPSGEVRFPDPPARK